MYNGLSAGNPSIIMADGAPQRLHVEILYKVKALYKIRYSPVKYESTYVWLTLIELIWTITPAVILILIAFPSFKLLYLMD